jgi:hypothetical protein
MSSGSAPVGITLTSPAGSFPSLLSRMIDPLPNCFSIVASARSIAESR